MQVTQISAINFYNDRLSLVDKHIEQLFRDNQYLSKYPQVEAPSKYCPYLHDNGQLIMDARKLLDQKNHEIKTTFPYLYSFWQKQSTNNYN